MCDPFFMYRDQMHQRKRMNKAKREEHMRAIVNEELQKQMSNITMQVAALLSPQ
jgi:hypothetical protein